MPALYADADAQSVETRQAFREKTLLKKPADGKNRFGASAKQRTVEGEGMKTIQANFDSVDSAERAIRRLKQNIPGFMVDYDVRAGSTPAAAPYKALVLYPNQAVNNPIYNLNQGVGELGSRVLFTSDIIGVPIYKSGPAEIEVQVNDTEESAARGMLRNSGAYDMICF